MCNNKKLPTEEQPGLIKTLLKNRANPNQFVVRGGALHCPAYSPEIFAELLSHRTNTNAVDNDNNTPLHIFVKEVCSGQSRYLDGAVVHDFAVPLLQHSADLNITDNKSRMPIQSAQTSAWYRKHIFSIFSNRKNNGKNIVIFEAFLLDQRGYFVFVF